jgi:hypothetical protein
MLRVAVWLGACSQALPDAGPKAAVLTVGSGFELHSLLPSLGWMCETELGFLQGKAQGMRLCSPRPTFLCKVWGMQKAPFARLSSPSGHAK